LILCCFPVDGTFDRFFLIIACATNYYNSAHYFHAPDNAALQKIFNQIAGGLSELRLIQ
jgi:hypothetical protein